MPACLPRLVTAVPTFSTLDILTSAMPMLVSFRAAYADIRATRDHIAHIYSHAFDADLYFPIDTATPIARYHPKSLVGV